MIDVDYTAWGWMHLILGIVTVFAGFALTRGATWARIVVRRGRDLERPRQPGLHVGLPDLVGHHDHPRSTTPLSSTVTAIRSIFAVTATTLAGTSHSLDSLGGLGDASLRHIGELVMDDLACGTSSSMSGSAGVVIWLVIPSWPTSSETPTGAKALWLPSS